MTRKYIFDYEEEKYILRKTNPSKMDEPFVLSKKDMRFDTKKY